MESELVKIKQALDADEVRELHRLRAENARLLDDFFRMDGENMGLNITVDILNAENARLLEVLKNILPYAEIGVPYPVSVGEINVIDAARAAIAEAEKITPSQDAAR